MRTLVFAVLAAVALGQTPKPSFEVVSIRPGSMKPMALPNGMSVIGGMQGGPGTSDPGMVRMNSVTLKQVVVAAYRMQRYQVSGPDWIDNTRYDINATVPAGATKEQYELMLQDMLESRFNLKVHHESKDFKAYNLVEAKGGLKLKDSVSTDICSMGGRPVNGSCPPGAVPISGIAKSAPGGQPMAMSGPKDGGFVATGKASTIGTLAGMLQTRMQGPLVIDKTGIEGTYDFRLEFASNDVGTAGDFSLPSVFTAVEKELGLKLEPTSEPLDVLVIDKIEKPTEN